MMARDSPGERRRRRGLHALMKKNDFTPRVVPRGKANTKLLAEQGAKAILDLQLQRLTALRR